jgi:hypothetical protein
VTAALWRGVLCAVLVLRAATTQAHTLASTVVSVKMTHSDVVMITIAAEADPLIAKLEALAGIATSHPPTTRDGRRTRLESLVPTLRGHIDARVAGTPLLLELQDIAVDDTAQVEMHLTAKAPALRAFTWRCSFIFGAYQLATTNGGAAEVVEWLQGPQASTPITLEAIRAEVASSVTGSTVIRIGHSLAMCALVAYFLRRRRRYSGAGG